MTEITTTDLSQEERFQQLENSIAELDQLVVMLTNIRDQYYLEMLRVIIIIMQCVLLIIIIPDRDMSLVGGGILIVITGVLLYSIHTKKQKHAFDNKT